MADKTDEHFSCKKGGLPLWEVLVTLGSSTTGPLILLGPLKHIVYLMHLKL